MDYSRTTAAALLAVSAGACVGLALSSRVKFQITVFQYEDTSAVWYFTNL